MNIATAQLLNQLEIDNLTKKYYRENSLQGPRTNHASFYGPAQLQLPYVTMISFSFPSMALLLHLQLTPS
jgi:hypothetical protein